MAPEQFVVIGRAMRSRTLLLIGSFLSACGSDRSKVAHSDEPLPPNVISRLDREVVPTNNQESPPETPAADETPAPPHGETSSPCRSVDSLPEAASRQPGDIDQSFGRVGVVNTMLDVLDVAEQADGRVLFTGWDHSEKLTVCRMMANGAPDETFGSSCGCASVPRDAVGAELHVGNDGRVLVVGDLSDSRLIVARFSSTGVLDSSFGIGGTAEFVNDGSLIPRALRVTENRIVVGGALLRTVMVDGYLRETSKGFLIGLTLDGSIDNGFGVNGWVDFEDPQSPRFSSANDIAVFDDGSLIVASRNAVHGFDDGGNRDPSFAQAGYLALPFPSFAMIRVGDAVVISGNGMRVLRASKTGVIEELSDEIEAAGAPVTMALSHDGLIVLAGDVDNGTTDLSPGIGRRLDDGSIDHTLRARSYAAGTLARRIFVLRNGRYLLVGTARLDAGFILRIWN